MKSKIISTDVKGLPIEANEQTKGIITFYASTFDDVPDKVGDIVLPTAFDKSLEEWNRSGKRMPIVWSHEHDKVEAYIGWAIDMHTDQRGLLVTAQLDLEDATARKIYNMIASRIITSCSFAYEIREGTPNEYGGLDLADIDIKEAGPCLIPANDYAEVVGWKSEKENAMEEEETSADIKVDAEFALTKSADPQLLHDLAVQAGAVCVHEEAEKEETPVEEAEEEEVIEEETKEEVKVEESAEEPVSEESTEEPSFDDAIVQLESELLVMESEALLS